MKQCKFFGYLLFVFVVLAAWGCSKDSSTSSGGGIKGGPIVAVSSNSLVLKAHKTIDSLAILALDSDNPVERFKTMLAQIRIIPGVESANVQGVTLGVKYAKGGIELWSDFPPMVIPPYVERTVRPGRTQHYASSSVVNSRDVPGQVGNNRVCFINQQYTDESRTWLHGMVSELKTEFQVQDFTVDVINGSAANLGFFKSSFAKYGTIFYISHGANFDDVTWVATGDEVADYAEALSKYAVELNNHEIAVHTITEERGGETVHVKYISFCPKLIQKNYTVGAFPNTLIYLVACQGMKQSDMAVALNAKGCQSVIGWSETKCESQGTGKLLFQHLLGGETVGEALASMPAEALVDDCAGVDADLVYYPNSGNEAYLFPAANGELPITITSVSNNEVILDRTVNIKGHIGNAQSLTTAILEVNGNAIKLEYDADFNFDQNIDIVAGNNLVNITATGINASGAPAAGKATLKLTGDFPGLHLWTKLRWNTAKTDVDLHLLPPGVLTSELFTNADCYYSNPEPYWGAYLDVDDTDGWGPEHIAMPNSPAPGVYTLVVHYYDRHDGYDPSAFISVETPTQTWESSNLSLYNSYKTEDKGDAWAVCYIEYPSGKITPIQQRIVTPRDGATWNIPKKVKSLGKAR